MPPKRGLLICKDRQLYQLNGPQNNVMSMRLRTKLFHCHQIILFSSFNTSLFLWTGVNDNLPQNLEIGLITVPPINLMVTVDHVHSIFSIKN